MCPGTFSCWGKDVVFFLLALPDEEEVIDELLALGPVNMSNFALPIKAKFCQTHSMPVHLFYFCLCLGPRSFYLNVSSSLHIYHGHLASGLQGLGFIYLSLSSGLDIVSGTSREFNKHLHRPVLFSPQSLMSTKSIPRTVSEGVLGGGVTSESGTYSLQDQSGGGGKTCGGEGGGHIQAPEPLNLTQCLAHSNKCLLVNFSCFESSKYSFLSGGSGSKPPYFFFKKKKNYLF